MPDQDGARIDARALLSGQERLEIQGRPVLLPFPLCSQCAAVSVRSVLHPHEQQLLLRVRTHRSKQAQGLAILGTFFRALADLLRASLRASGTFTKGRVRPYGKLP